jgi:4-amino-4-deoxy-L-arabinose transferase-like glycosyltransferase
MTPSQPAVPKPRADAIDAAGETGAIRRSKLAGPLALAIVVIGYAGLALSHLGGLRWDSDEGINLSKAWLVADGFGLYREVWADQPPGYTLLTALVFRIFGPSIGGARALTVILSLAGLIGVALAARALHRELMGERASEGPAWIAGIAAALVLAIAPNFWWASRAAMIGLPAFAWGALAMGLALEYARAGGSRHLALAALALGISLWMKLQMLYLGLPLGLLILWRHRGSEWSARLRDLAILGAGSLGPLLLSALVFGPRRFYAQVFGTYLDTRASYPVSFADNFQTLQTWIIHDNLGLALLAFAGLLCILRRRGPAGSLALAWTALTVVTAMQHAPLWIKDHFEPLLFALVTLAGVVAGQAAERWPARAFGRDSEHGSQRAPMTDDPLDTAGRRRFTPRWEAWAIGGLLVWLWMLPHVLTVDASLARAQSYHNDGNYVVAGSGESFADQRREDELRAAADLLAIYSEPTDFVATDYQLVAFLAGRRVVPEMAAFSSRAVEVGAFSDRLLIEATTERRAPVVLLWDAEIQGFAGYRDYLDGRTDAHGQALAGGQQGSASGPAYVPSELELGNDRHLWIAADRKGALDGLPQFGPLARLIGHTMDWNAETRLLDLRLVWQVIGQSDTHRSIFTQVYGRDGERYGQHDGTPAEGGEPTTEWQPGRILIDRHPIPIDAGAPGSLSIHIGLYDPENGAREPLTVEGVRVDGDALVLPERIDPGRGRRAVQPRDAADGGDSGDSRNIGDER